MKKRSIFDNLVRVLGRKSYDVKGRLNSLLAVPNFLDMFFGCLCMSVISAHSSSRSFARYIYLHAPCSFLETHQWANCMGNSTIIISGVSTFKLSVLVRKEDNFFKSSMFSVKLTYLYLNVSTPGMAILELGLMV